MESRHYRMSEKVLSNNATFQQKEKFKKEYRARIDRKTLLVYFDKAFKKISDLVIEKSFKRAGIGYLPYDNKFHEQPLYLQIVEYVKEQSLKITQENKDADVQSVSGNEGDVSSPTSKCGNNKITSLCKRKAQNKPIEKAKKQKVTHVKKKTIQQILKYSFSPDLKHRKKLKIDSGNASSLIIKLPRDLVIKPKIYNSVSITARALGSLEPNMWVMDDIFSFYFGFGNNFTLFY